MADKLIDRYQTDIFIDIKKNKKILRRIYILTDMIIDMTRGLGDASGTNPLHVIFEHTLYFELQCNALNHLK